jgi:hypothetical protein
MEHRDQEDVTPCESAEGEDGHHRPHEIADPAEFGVEPGFAVTDEKTANWVVWRIVAARIRAERAAAFAAAESNRAEREEKFYLVRFGSQLEQFAREKLAQMKGRGKTVRLPAGSLCFRAQPPHLVIEDEAAVLAWASAHAPALIRTVKTVSKSGLNEHVRMTGELPDRGVRVEGPLEKFSVR